jgi:hypothetical protein
MCAVGSSDKVKREPSYIKALRLPCGTALPTVARSSGTCNAQLEQLLLPRRDLSATDLVLLGEPGEALVAADGF